MCLNVLNDIENPTSSVAYNLDKEAEWSRPVVSSRIEVILELCQRGEPIYRRDLAQDDPFDEHQSGAHGDIRSVLDIPFSHGTFALNSSKANTFSNSHIAALEELAAVLSEGFRRRDDLQALKRRERL